ncbi:MAG: PIN domain-containing protein [Polaromonas sp.]|nr:PIN domain-containing protein [Polaromonas sp.]
MILVDSSVWIDFFRGTRNAQTDQLDVWLDKADAEIGVADLVVFEVMRGFARVKEQACAKDLLLTLDVVEIGGLDNALLAARHYRELRALGYTIHSPIDVLLASYCITHDHLLLHRDADFGVMETLRGLKVWRH